MTQKYTQIYTSTDLTKWYTACLFKVLYNFLFCFEGEKKIISNIDIEMYLTLLDNV